MNLASLFSLAGPDLIIILLIVLLLFGAKKARRQWTGSESEPEKGKESPMALLNRLLVPIAIVIFLLACGIWVFGQSD